MPSAEAPRLDRIFSSPPQPSPFAASWLRPLVCACALRPSAIEAASTAAAGVDLVAAPTTPTSVPTATSPDEPPPKGVEGNALQLTS